MNVFARLMPFALTALTSAALAEPPAPPAGLAPASFPTDPALLEAIPEGGLLLASKPDSWSPSALRVHRLTRRGLETVFEDPTSLVYTGAFANADTLWVLARDQEDEATGVIATRFSGGTPTARIAVPFTAFGAAPSPDYPLVDLAVSPAGDAYLSICTDFDVMRAKPCKRHRHLAVVEGATRPIEKLPRGVMSALDTVGLAALPKARVKPLSGYRLVKRDVEGVAGLACTTPAGDTTLWPGPDGNREFQVQPKRITWLSHEPPLVVLEGKKNHPLGTTPGARDVLRLCSEQAYFRFRWLAPRLFAAQEQPFGATLTDPLRWTLYLDQWPIATVAAESIFLAPPP